MPVVRIGNREITYEVRKSPTAKQRRITVTPEQVEVVVPLADDEAAIEQFLKRKRNWLYDAVRDIEEAVASRHVVPRFMSGSRVPFRGRKMALTVRWSDVEQIQISYRNGFFIDLPPWVADDPSRVVSNELKIWLKQRVRRDVKAIAAAYQRKHGLTPASIRTVDLAHGWGSCSPKGHVLINWHLVLAPMKVLEYVVAHELAHLKVRTHGPEFWDYLSAICPDYPLAKAWLDKHQAGLSADFLL